MWRDAGDVLADVRSVGVVDRECAGDCESAVS